MPGCQLTAASLDINPSSQANGAIYSARFKNSFKFLNAFIRCRLSVELPRWVQGDDIHMAIETFYTLDKLAGILRAVIDALDQSPFEGDPSAR